MRHYTYNERRTYKRKRFFAKLRRVVLYGIFCILTVIILGGFLHPASETQDFYTNILIPAPTEVVPTTPSDHTYKYLLNNRPNVIHFTTYKNVFNIYNSKNKGYFYSSFENEVIYPMFNDTTQSKFLNPLVNSIKQQSNDPSQQAKIAISLVQHIPYNWGGSGFDWKYPYETLHEETGVCSDKSVLMAYLLNELNYNVVLFKFPNHMAVGIKSAPQYGFCNTEYAFIETTRPTIITYEPPVYIDGSHLTTPEIIPIYGGTQSLDVSIEYQDAQHYTKLMNMGEVLDQYNYDQWVVLTNKYDLECVV